MVSAIRWFLVCVLSLWAPVAYAEPSAEEILLRSDEVRNPQLDYTVIVKVTDFKPGKESRISVYEVMVQGHDKTVIRTLNPPIDRGRVLLMRGNDLWAFLPDVSKPLRVSLQERLTGEVANGDLARVNFSGDYRPEIVRVERQGEHEYYVLNLTAKSDDVTYARVVLRVEKDTSHPHQAEFYAVSGRLLKYCSYGHYRELAGRLRPTQLTMRDAVVEVEYSVIEYDELRVAPLPEKYFTKDYMKKFME